jgi:hypothetical protein
VARGRRGQQCWCFSSSLSVSSSSTLEPSSSLSVPSSSPSIHLLPSSSLVVLQPPVLLLPSSVTRFTRRENTWVCRLLEAVLFTGVYVHSHRLLLQHVQRVNVFFVHKSYFLRINKMQNHSKKIAHKGRDATGVRAALASARSCGAPSCT